MAETPAPRIKLDSLTEIRRYIDEVDYDRTDCTGNCGFCCRCSSLTNVRLRSLNVTSFMESVIPKKLHHTIMGYCAERMLRHSGVGDKDNWSVEVRQGYYGQEVDGVRLDWQIAKAATDHIKRILAFRNDALRMEHILKLEYGYLLPSLQKKAWTIRQIPRNDVVIGQDDHYYRKLNRKLVEGYQDHTFPVAVCAVIDGVYRLIDGYHRFSSTEGKRKVTVVIAEGANHDA